MDKQRVYITSGVSGSGKSTWIKEKGIDSVSTDELVDDYAKSNGYTYTEAFEEIQSKKLFGNMNSIFYDNIIHSINSGSDFVIDRTSLNHYTRKSLIDFIRTYTSNAVIIVVIFKVSKKIVLERLEKREKETGKGIPKEVIEKQFESFEEPLYVKEKFDELVIVT
jgi:predicted kinase|tara:strand:- start:161 stop:655 length:495 start_codon:yes stop_codon:yes gene_type:complete